MPARYRLAVFALLFSSAAFSQTDTQTYRLYHGITAYVNNPGGVDFDVEFDLRDLNIYANGPREVLFKVYDPTGKPVVREVIPDDGVASESYIPAIGGWDHELQYYALCYSRGTKPMIRWSSLSDPQRLAKLSARHFKRSVSGPKGIYRIVLVGERDHSVDLKISPSLKYAVCGHHTFIHGRSDMFKKRFIYVPKGTDGLHLAFAEPDEPRGRRFTTTSPDGKVLADIGPTAFRHQQVRFEKPGQYDDQILTLNVSDGPGDYLMKITLQRRDKDYVGMGTEAILASDEDTAKALKGGAIYHDDGVFWHPFQVRFHDWLKANKADEALQAELQSLFTLMNLIGPSDGRGSKSFLNWGYAFGYYGCKIWRPGWQLINRADVPQAVKDIIKEAFITGGDRLSFAIGIERVNGNAFAQIPVALWYCHKATGDALQKQRFETYFTRWRTEGWGKGCGISKTGDSQEHFAHSANYGWYIMDNWSPTGGTWVDPGILADTDDPRFRETWDRVREAFSYFGCPEAAANPWSARTMGPVAGKWQSGEHAKPWKGNPGPDFTVSVNNGNEWFAARRKNYYMLTFHGRLSPEWLSNTFHGQLGFGGGAICQLTIPGKGTVLASTLNGDYGKGMHLANWRNFHIHSLAGEMWDEKPFSAAVSEHNDAKLTGNIVTSSGEVRGHPIRSNRKFTFAKDSITCEVQLAPTDYQPLIAMWSGGRPLAHVREAYEMIPYLKPRTGEISITSGEGVTLSKQPLTTMSVIIDRGGFGVRIEVDEPTTFMLGENNTVLISIVTPAAKPTAAEKAGLVYRLVPFQ